MLGINCSHCTNEMKEPVKKKVWWCPNSVPQFVQHSEENGWFLSKQAQDLFLEKHKGTPK